MKFFPDFDAILEEDTREEYLDEIAYKGYSRRQEIMEQLRKEISHLDSGAKDAFWEGWYS